MRASAPSDAKPAWARRAAAYIGLAVILAPVARRNLRDGDRVVCLPLLPGLRARFSNAREVG